MKPNCPLILKDVTAAAWMLTTLAEYFSEETLYHAVCLTYNRHVQNDISLEQAAKEVVIIFSSLETEYTLAEISKKTYAERKTRFDNAEAYFAFSLLGLAYGRTENYIPDMNYAINLDDFNLEDRVAYEWNDIVYVRLDLLDPRNVLTSVASEKRWR